MGDSTASELRQLEERRIYVLNPAPDSRRTGGDGVPLGDLISGVWRRRWVIGAITLLGGVLAYASVSFKPTVYEAKAILLVQAPQFSSELKPAPLSVATYQALLNSDYTAAKVRERLVNAGDIPEGTSAAEIRGMVTTTIPIIEGVRVANPQLPMIEILASARQPEIAGKVANTFARVFAQGSLEVATQGRAGSMELIESQYPVTKKMLQNTTVELKNRQDQYADALLELQNSWNRRNHDFKKETQDLVDKPERETRELVHDFKKETQDLVDKYERETRELVLAFADTHKPELTEAKLARQKSRFNSLDSELESNRLSLKGAHHVLVELERLIKREPRYLVVSKAITDSALWNRIGEDSAGRLPEELKDLALREEVPNLIHEKIMGSLIDAQMKVETLKPKQEDLTAEIERVRLEIEELSSEVTRIKLDQFNLGRQRALDLSRLKATRNLDQFNLGRQRALELTRLKEARGRKLADLQALEENRLGAFSREKDLQLEALTLEKKTASSSFSLISKQFESVRLARSEEEPDVKIGALALRPEVPVAKGLMARTALGLVAAFFLALFGATIAEAVSGYTREQHNSLNAKTQLDERLPQELIEG